MTCKQKNASLGEMQPFTTINSALTVSHHQFAPGNFLPLQICHKGVFATAALHQTKNELFSSKLKLPKKMESARK